MKLKRINQNKKDNIIVAKNLSVYFQRNGILFQALKNVDITVKKGEVLGIVGESGSGKTTLGRSIISLWDHKTGEVRIDDQIVPKKRIKYVNKKNRWIYEKGQMIYQDPSTSLIEIKTIKEILLQGYNNFKTLDKDIKSQKKSLANEKELVVQLQSDLNDDRRKSFIPFNSYEKYQKEYNNLLEKIGVKDKRYRKYVQVSENLKNLYRDSVEIQRDIESFHGSFRKDKKLIKSSSTSMRNQFINEFKFGNQIVKKWKSEEAGTIKALKNNPPNYSTHPEAFAALMEFLVYVKNNLQSKLGKDDDFINLQNLRNKITEKNINDYLEGLKVTAGNIIEKVQNQKHKNQIQLYVDWIENILLPASLLNTREFKDVIKYVSPIIREKRTYLEKEVSDIVKLIKYKNDSFKNAADGNTIKLLQFDIQLLNEKKDMTKEKLDFYKQFEIEFSETAKLHKEENSNEFFDLILQENKIARDMNILFNSWKRKKQLKSLSLKIGSEIAKLRMAEGKVNAEIEKNNNYFKNFNYDHFVAKTKNANFELFNSLRIRYFSARNQKTIAKESVILDSELTRLNNEDATLDQILNDKVTREKYVETKLGEILEKVGLSADILSSYPSEFSGGQRQRIGIARSVITKPEFIVADEPISALDVSLQAGIINLLKDLQEEFKMSIIFIAHDLEMVNYIADRICVIYKGDIVEIGPAESVYNKPVHPYTKALINAQPSLKHIGDKLPTEEYSEKIHLYNDYTLVREVEVRPNHWVRGTKEEIDKWTKK